MTAAQYRDISDIMSTLLTMLAHFINVWNYNSGYTYCVVIALLLRSNLLDSMMQENYCLFLCLQQELFLHYCTKVDFTSICILPEYLFHNLHLINNVL